MIPSITPTIDSPEDYDIITAFYLKHKMLLYHEAWKYLNLQEDVEDIVYETLVRIIENIDKFRHMAPLQQIQYAKVIVRNLSYVLLKRSTYFTMIPFESIDLYLPIEESETPDSIISQKLQRAQIRTIWAEVPPEDRLLLEQKYILDWSDELLAARLDIKPQSVRMRLTRAKRRTMKLMIEHGIQISEWL